ncbi:MAG: hypothetical protein AB1540_07220 [Bdellovibrionota bacterium]
MKQTTTILLLLLALTLISACTSVRVDMPANRFESPETNGALLKGHIEPAALQGINEVVLVEDYTRRPPRNDTPEFSESDYAYRFSAGIGVLERLDVDLRVHEESPTMLGVKYQFLGEPRAKEVSSDFKLAVSAGAGAGNRKGSSTDTLFTQSGQYDVDFLAFDLAVILGYRLTPAILFYGGPFAYWLDADGEIAQPAAGGTTYPLDGSGREFGTNLGVQFDLGPLLIKLEEAWAMAQFGVHKRAHYHTGLLLGFQW